MSIEVPSGSVGTPGSDAAPAADPRRSLLDVVARELRVALGSLPRIEAACAELRRRLHHPPDPLDETILAGLAALLKLRAGPPAEPVFALLADALPEATNADSLLLEMIRSRDAALARSALALAAERVRGQAWIPDATAIEAVAARVTAEDSPFDDRPSLDAVATLLSGGPAEDPEALLSHLESPAARVRAAAARVLDRRDEPAPMAATIRLLGRDRVEALRPWLATTRTGFADLLLVRDAPELDASLRRAGDVCGAALLAEVVARLGWAAIADGIDVRRVSFPDGDAPGDRYVVTARGRAVDIVTEERESAERVGRFRELNLAHARLLGDFMSLAPLTPDRLDRLLTRMNAVVTTYAALFAEMSAEAGAVEAVFAGLRERITRAGREGGRHELLPGEVERLVLPFEDPRSLTEVGTLHGLKRYLHREGLRLGSRLADVSGRPGRTVSVAVASPAGIETAVGRITWADFEGAADPRDGLPFPVAIAADGMARHLLYGHREFPRIRVFCYGNEVHYFLSYGFHPVFVRVDFSPPARGGMIALEYFGVSRNDLGAHPDAALPVVRRFLEGLDFEVEVDRTRIRARYDHDRARHLGEICDRAAALFGLVPHLMDLDWVVGSLDLDADAKRDVVEAWFTFFRERGVLPVARFLTPDRRGIRTPAPTFPDERATARPDSSGRWEAISSPHPVRIFGDALAGGGADFENMVAAAPAAAGVERDLEWTGLGSVNGHRVERGALPLVGTWLEVAVLRDRRGVIRLARFAETDASGGIDPPRMGLERVRDLLRRHGYLDPDLEMSGRPPLAEIRELRQALRRPDPGARPRLTAGERRVTGLAAAPGRAAGAVLLAHPDEPYVPSGGGDHDRSGDSPRRRPGARPGGRPGGHRRRRPRARRAARVAVPQAGAGGRGNVVPDGGRRDGTPPRRDRRGGDRLHDR